MGDRIEKLTTEVKALTQATATITVDRAKLTAQRDAEHAALVKWNEQQDAAIKALQARQGIR